MSNKLEAALGGEPANTFTDDQGVTFEAIRRTLIHDWEGHTEVIEFRATRPDWKNGPSAVAFWAEDATKIIALIAEAAK